MAQYFGGGSLSVLDKGLLAHALVTVVGDGVSDFVSHNDSDSRVCLAIGQNPLVENDFPSGHTPCVRLVAGNKVEFPLKVGNLILQAVCRQILFHGFGNTGSHVFYALFVYRIGGEFIFFQETAVRG